MQELSKTLALGSAAPLSVTALVLALGIGLVLALILRWHFQRFGSTLSNRAEFAQVFPFLVMTTILIITVVKSSLALSLGLVGALSIVRFRTPIKEPEELAYLFMAIAIGLGLGADQFVPTTTAVVIILVSIGALRWSQNGNESKNLYLSIDCPVPEGAASPIPELEAVLRQHVSTGDLRRIDKRDGTLEATYWVEIDDTASIAQMIEEFERAFPGIGITFIDQQRVPAI
ncbi:MAG TPA: DUF4956 domain-containing protein [Myxococcales bacterium]|nr:DUF4956 domain-containing protein [Myxococcales bacterium]HIL81122.1 DUF4956 domain-containing protein [Myxococcales bacterium]